MGIQLRPHPSHRPPPGVELSVVSRAELPLIAEHLTRLDPESRHERFNGSVDTEWINKYVERSRKPGVMVIAAKYDGQVIGVAELHPSGSSAAELAFSVNQEWRRRGVGSALFAVVLNVVWFRGLKEVRLNSQAENEAMHHLARKFSARISLEHGDMYGLITLPPPPTLPSV
jgi:RimJ/RimL family protein N-acetyltransferase